MQTDFPEYWVIIPAAGVGSRFGKTFPKQYLKIGEKTVIEHTISLFLSLDWITKIVIVLSPDDTFFSQLPLYGHSKLVCVPGAEERMDSVLNALNHLETIVKKQDWILVHDAVRPCLHPKDLRSLVTDLQDDRVGGILATPVQDTLKYLDEKQNITHTVERTNLWQAQTPQMFRFELLINAYRHSKKLGLKLTDDASAVEQLAIHPKVVKSEHPNPKLTLARDLPFVRALLTSQEM